MKYFAVLSAVVSCSLAAPVAEADAEAQALLLAKPYINSGSAAGPLTPLVGDLVATNRGYAPLSLEGFSEDVNEDGFVDPIAHAAPVVAVAAPVAYHAAPVAYHAAPLVAAPAVAEVKTVEVKAAAPAVVPAATYAYAAPAAYHVAAPAAVHVATAPVVQHVGYQVHHQVQHIPKVTVQKHTSTHTTHHVINHAPVVGAFSGLIPVAGLPVAAAAAAAAAPAAEAEAAPVVEEA
eukprot:TRINITY_DN769_c0_g1_i9.p1 TRINITY_DN769_c0_g1~~TRINITY_DN769_c0_g1_i9.p1  ORF type:complete len:252 (-),score=124.33 TRINITY_DN769_c0_g1_i9:440-1141(-)